MSEKISEYVADATSNPLHPLDLMDLSSFVNPSFPASYDVSKKITLVELTTYISGILGNTFYIADGTLTGNRTVTSNSFWTKFDGGDVIIDMDNESDDYAFIVNSVGIVEQARLGYDQLTQSAIFELSNLTTKFIEFNDNVVNLNVSPIASWDISEPQLSTAQAGFAGIVRTDRVAYVNNVGYGQASILGVYEILVGLGIGLGATTLTADRTQTYQDKDGVIALTSDIPQGLSPTLAISNVMLDTDRIKSTDGKTEVQVNTIGAGLQHGTIGVDIVSYIEVSDKQAQMFLFNTTFTKTGNLGLFSNDVLRNFNAGSTPSYPSKISCQGGIFNANVINSAQIGGNSTILKTDQTAYINQLGFNTGETFETILSYATPTADRLQTLQNKDGIIALLSDVSTPALSSVLAVGEFTNGKNIGLTDGDSIQSQPSITGATCLLNLSPLQPSGAKAITISSTSTGIKAEDSSLNGFESASTGFVLTHKDDRKVEFKAGNNNKATFDMNLNSADRVYTFPDSDINFATAITETLNFATDSVGQVSTMTFANGILISRTLSV